MEHLGFHKELWLPGWYKIWSEGSPGLGAACLSLWHSTAPSQAKGLSRGELEAVSLWGRVQAPWAGDHWVLWGWPEPCESCSTRAATWQWPGGAEKKQSEKPSLWLWRDIREKVQRSMWAMFVLVLWVWYLSDKVKPSDKPIYFFNSRPTGGDEQWTLPPMNLMYWLAVTSPYCHSCISSLLACGKGKALQGVARTRHAASAVRLSSC